MLAQGVYERYRYTTPRGEYGRKLAAAQAAQANGRRITTVFAGDSTVSVGIMPSILGPSAFNLAWSGFEPSQLRTLENAILALSSRPTKVVLGLNPTFLSQNEWRNTLAVPLSIAFREGLESFYSDTNSLKPFIIMGGFGYLSERFLAPPFGDGLQVREEAGVETIVEQDGLLVVQGARRTGGAQREDVGLRYRDCNFWMIERFRIRLAQAGIRVVWVFMPYSGNLERALREGPVASRFQARYRAEIERIFGNDVVDLSGSVPDELFRDEVHLTKSGAETATRHLLEAPALLPSAGSGGGEPSEVFKKQLRR
jgi:hypothetical protein